MKGLDPLSDNTLQVHLHGLGKQGSSVLMYVP